jgi:hypothetical protein
MRNAVPQCGPALSETPIPDPFPTMEQVEKADREQIARWHCFLSAPNTASEQNIADRIADRFLNTGGLTPGLSQKIGFKQNPPAPSTRQREARSN